MLGIARDATPQQVAGAHRRLAKRFHPDLHPDEETAAHMRRVNEA
ncbi:MAG: J domain-containing protein, partial [Candidatus Limnocylindria bacterium]